jgi:hypothetical protein
VGLVALEFLFCHERFPLNLYRAKLVVPATLSS